LSPLDIRRICPKCFCTNALTRILISESTLPHAEELLGVVTENEIQTCAVYYFILLYMIIWYLAFRDT
jgi:hypothetical protein